MLACGVRASQPAAARANKQAAGLVSLTAEVPEVGAQAGVNPAGWKLHHEV